MAEKINTHTQKKKKKCLFYSCWVESQTSAFQMKKQSQRVFVHVCKRLHSLGKRQKRKRFDECWWKHIWGSLSEAPRWRAECVLARMWQYTTHSSNQWLATHQADKSTQALQSNCTQKVFLIINNTTRLEVPVIMQLFQIMHAVLIQTTDKHNNCMVHCYMCVTPGHYQFLQERFSPQIRKQSFS